MTMKKFINNPDNITAELLEGLALANPKILEVTDQSDHQQGFGHC